RVGEHLLRRRCFRGRRKARSRHSGSRGFGRSRYARLRRVAEDRNQGRSVAIHRRRRSLLEGIVMKVREVIEAIKQNLGVPFPERSIRDTLKTGDPEMEVKGIATTMMATFDMLKRANAAGLN